jgi:hypothetical protein
MELVRVIPELNKGAQELGVKLLRHENQGIVTPSEKLLSSKLRYKKMTTLV